jgi:ParB-like chromosome segregation protein Spo0J
VDGNTHSGRHIQKDVRTTSVSSLLPGDSPRLAGEDDAHIAWLAETQATLPPILVDQRSMRVIDGMHRLRAALLKGQETIDVEFFDGNADDAFLRAVEANVKHGLPLSLGDRQAAAARVIASHPHMSDRAIAESTGLAAKSVAAIRRSEAGPAPQLGTRLGKDGRMRPLDCSEGRRRAAQLFIERPQASLREIARHSGISPGTARDVRRRLELGVDPVLNPEGKSARTGGSADRDAGSRDQRARPASAAILDKLMRNPSLRHSEKGRRLLRWLQSNALEPQERSQIIDGIPPHCMDLVAQIAHQYSGMWQEFAQDLTQLPHASAPTD